mmetsp:Transcript_17809/g.39482  ORF Transcript_17809/g.39482 Transcript_17809/m.39482 type:complete len:346 (-) Transcript_17809:542-1579(-)
MSCSRGRYETRQGSGRQARNLARCLMTPICTTSTSCTISSKTGTSSSSTTAPSASMRATSCREWASVCFMLVERLWARMWYTSRTSCHRLGPMTWKTAGKLNAQMYLRSLSTLASPVGLEIMLQYWLRMFSLMARAGRVATNIPACCKTLCFTSLEGSCVRRRNISTKTPSRTSSLTFLDISERLSAHARRTRYMSSLDRRTKAGISRSKSSCSPPTLHMLWKLRAVDLRTRKTGSSARETTSGMTNCLHRSAPRASASRFSSCEAVMRISSRSSSWARRSMMVSTYCPMSSILISCATSTSVRLALCRTSSLSSSSSVAVTGRMSSSTVLYPSSPPASQQNLAM